MKDDDLDFSESELFSDDETAKDKTLPKVPKLNLQPQQSGNKAPKDTFFDKDALFSDDDATPTDKKPKNSSVGNQKQPIKNGKHSNTLDDDLDFDIDGLDESATPQKQTKKHRNYNHYQSIDSKSLDLSSADYQNMMKEITASVNEFKNHKTQNPFSYEQEKQLKEIQDSVKEYKTKLKKEHGSDAELDFRSSDDYKMKIKQLERDTDSTFNSINKSREFNSSRSTQPDTVDKLYRVLMENQALEEQRKKLDKRLDVQDNKPQEESLSERLKRIAEENQRLMSENQQLDQQLKSSPEKKPQAAPPQLYSAESRFDLPPAIQELISKRYERPAPSSPPLSPIKPDVSNMSMEQDDSAESFPVQHQSSPERAKRVANLHDRITKLALENEKLQKYHVNNTSATSGVSTPRSDQSRMSRITDSSGLEYYSKKLALLQSFHEDDITIRPSSSMSVQSRRSVNTSSMDPEKEQFKKQALKQRLADATNLLNDLIDTSINQKQRLQKNLKIVGGTLHSTNNPPKPKSQSVVPKRNQYAWEQSPYKTSSYRQTPTKKKKKKAKEPPKTDFIQRNKELASLGLLSYGTKLNFQSTNSEPTTPQKPPPPRDKDFIQKNIHEVKKKSEVLSSQNFSNSIEQAMKLFQKSRKVPSSPTKKGKPSPVPPIQRVQTPPQNNNLQQPPTPKPLPKPPPRKETPRKIEEDIDEIEEEEPVEEEPIEEEPIEEESIEEEAVDESIQDEMEEEAVEEVSEDLSESIEDDYEAEIPDDDLDLEDELFDD